MTLATVINLRRPTVAPVHERVVYLFLLAYVLIQSRYVWTDAGELRASAELQIMSALMMVSSRKAPIGAYSAAAAFGWTITATRRIIDI
jgi:hypothetical protein